MTHYRYDDGGRSRYFKGSAGDCVVRSVAIAEGADYKEVYDDAKRFTGKTPRDGVNAKKARAWLLSRGWAWKPVMGIGTGCTMRLRPEDLPKGTIIARCSKHYVAVVDGVIRDTHDSSRDGTRCVYGYYHRPEEG